MSGTLYLVATPIGNLQDVTLRAVDTLRNVDLIACEDTRHTQKLLNHLGIKKKLISYHDHNEHSRSSELIGRLSAGESIAIVSDAGTPAINDPGFRIVQDAIENEIDVISIPGPTAFVTALTASGLPTDAFFFAGFLPAKRGERQNRLQELARIPGTLLVYEAPHRLLSSLKDCLLVLGNRKAVVARELTKLHEEFARGTISSLIDHFGNGTIKGEIVLLIDRDHGETAPANNSISIADRVAELESSGLDRKSALKAAAKEFGVSRSDAYRELQKAKNF